MDIEDVLRKVPKTILVPLVLIGAIVFFVNVNPMHTICDTQVENLQGRIVGLLTSVKRNKVVVPAALPRARANCKFGNNAGACLDYVTALKRLAKSVKAMSSECYPAAVNVESLMKAIDSGIIDLVTLAWGSLPPEKAMDRYGWFQENEVSGYCHLKDAYNLVHGPEEWKSFRSKVLATLPGEAPKVGADGKFIDSAPQKAVVVLGELEAMTRSLFSVGCDQFR